MREHATILPPPPPARVALWAAANVLWYRAVDVLSRILGAGRRRVAAVLSRASRSLRTLPALAGDSSPSIEVGRLVVGQSEAPVAGAAERPTAVEVKRSDR